MAEPPSGTAPTASQEPDPAALGHPRGTLAIVTLYGLLLAVGWIAMYVSFLGRGAPQP